VLTACKGSFTKGGFPDGADRRKIWFQLMANAREIRVDRIGFDMITHEYSGTVGRDLQVM
jgi:hypothetical protein